MGPTLRRWRFEWTERLKKNPDPDLVLPKAKMQPAGYILMQHAQRLDRLDTLKHYRSLMLMAMEAGKPMFHLKPADGAIGSHVYAVQECYKDFQRLTRKIAERCGVTLP